MIALDVSALLQEKKRPIIVIKSNKLLDVFSAARPTGDTDGHRGPWGREVVN